MSEKPARPVTPVAPDGMEIIFFYKCPRCERHVGIASPTEPKMLTCENCHFSFPIIPVEEHGLHYVRIMLYGGKAAADQDFF